MYDKLIAKVNNINTNGLVLKTKYDADKSDLEKKISDTDKKIPDTSGLVKKTNYNAKITEIEGKVPSITSLATTPALTEIENKIPDTSNFLKKTDNDAEILDIKSKYFTRADYKKLTNEKLGLKIKQKGLVDKSDIARFISNADLDKKSSNISNKSSRTRQHNKIISI